MAVEYVGKDRTSRITGHILIIGLFIKKPPELIKREAYSSLVITAMVANTYSAVANRLSSHPDRALWPLPTV